jgi:ribonuclease J
MSDHLEIISLGGSGGFGMNATLLVQGGDGLLVDYGSGFPGPVPAGVNRLVPDGEAVVDRCERLRGIVLTHGHDDHAAAIPHLPAPWSGVPVHGPRLALALVKDRLDDVGRRAPPLRAYRAGAELQLGSFRVRPIHVTHSIPDTYMLAIETVAGTLLHTGDFRFDPEPTVGPLTDWAALDDVVRRGVRLLLCDSTGALRDDPQLSETAVATHLERAIAGVRGQVVVSTFASQLHRIQSAVRIAARLGRQVSTLGMRMTRLMRHGVDLGLLDLPAGVVVAPDELARRAPEQRLWLAGGCQGEPDSTLSRLSHGADSRTSLGPGDRIVLSASVIPGSEVTVGLLVDRLLRLGAEVVDVTDEPRLHASGHAGQSGLLELMERARPRAVMPVHGDRRHLEACAALARRVRPEPVDILVSELGGHVVVGPERLSLRERVEMYPVSLDVEDRVVPREVVLARRRLGDLGVVVVRVPPSGSADPVHVEWSGLVADVDDDALRRQVAAAVAEVRDASRARGREDLVDMIARRVGSLVRSGRRRTPVLVLLGDDDGADAGT